MDSLHRCGGGRPLARCLDVKNIRHQHFMNEARQKCRPCALAASAASAVKRDEDALKQGEYLTHGQRSNP